MQLNILLASLLFISFLLTGCSTETIFQSKFDVPPNSLNQPPIQAQQVGTINIDASAGDVVVVNSPVSSGGKFVQIRNLPGSHTVPVMQCVFSKMAGIGEYSFSSFLYIPSGCGDVSVQLEGFAQALGDYTSLVHIDFMQDGSNVRLADDPNNVFGHFPHDQLFVLLVTFKTSDTEHLAHISLSGAGTSGEKDYIVPGPLIHLVPSFGAVRYYMGFGVTGAYQVSTIVVTHNK